MNAYDRVLEISNELTDAAGTTNLHYARYLNSVEAAANRSKVALEQLWIKTINSDVLKYFYNMATAIVTLVDKIGGLRIVFALLVLALMNVRKNVSAFFVNLTLLPAAFAQSIMMGRTFKETLNAIAVAFDLVKLKGIAMQAALSFGLSIAITLVIEGFLKLAGAMDAARQRNEELLYSYSQTIQQNNAHIKSLQALAGEYEYLSRKTSLTSEEQKRLNELQEEIANISPSVIQGYDEQGNVIVRLKGNVSDLIEELKEANRLKAFELVAGGKDAFKVMKKDINESQKQLEFLNLEIEHLQGNLDSQRSIYISSEADLFWEKNNAGLKQYEEALVRGAITETKFLEIKSDLENRMANLDVQAKKLAGDIDSATDSFRPYMRAILDSSDAFEKLDEEQKKFLYDFVSSAKDFGGSWDEASGNIRRLIEVVKKADFQEFVGNIEDLNTRFDEGTITAGEYEEEFNKIIVVMAELFDLDPEFLAEIFKKAIPEAKGVADAISEAEDALKRLNSEFDKATSSFDLLSKAADELDKYGQLSAKTMMDIVNNHDDLIVPMLMGEMSLREALNNKMLDLENEALRIFQEAAIKKLETSEIFFNEILKGNKEVWDQVANIYCVDGNNFTSVAQAKLEIDKAVREIVAEGWAETYGTTAQGIGQMISVLESQLSSLSKYSDHWARASAANIISQINHLRSLRAALGSISTAMNNVTSKIDLASISLGNLGSAAKSAASALKDPYEEWLRTATSIADQVIRIIKDAYNKQKKIALAAIDAERKAAEKAHKERIKQLDEQYKRYEELIKLRQREIDDEADEEDFLRELNKLQEEQGEIESEIAKLALDDSYEARAKREQLEKDLAAKIEEINNLTRNRDKTLRKQALQDQLDNMKKETDEKKSQQEEIYEAEKARLEKIREDTEYHYNELLNNELRFQEIRQAILEGNYERAKEILGEFVDYFGTFNEDMAHTMGVSFQNILNIMDAAKKAIEDLGNLGAPPPSTAGAEEGGGYGGFEGLAASSAAAAKSVKSDWEGVARTIGKQFGLTEGALEAFINTFTRKMEDGATVVEALESAWADASAHIIDNFVLTEDQINRFNFYFKKYFFELIDSGVEFSEASKIALDKTIDSLNLTKDQAEIFREIFLNVMNDGSNASQALDIVFNEVKNNLKTNLEITGTSLSEFGNKFEENMKTSQTSSEALKRTWSDVARNIVANTDMTEREIDVFAESFSSNMMASNDAAWSLEKAFGDVSSELQKDSNNNKFSVKNMVDEIISQMSRQVPTLKTRIENTITTIYETIEKVFGKKHEGGIAGIEKAHSGKIVGGASNKDSRAIWDLFSKDLKPYETLIKALDGEVVINPQISMPKFQKNMLGAMGAVANTSTDNSMVNNINFNITANATEADAKKIAKMTLTEIYRGQRRMGKH